MIIRAAGHDFNFSFHKAAAERLSIVDNTLLIGFKFLRKRLLKAYRLCRDDMHQRAALGAGEDCLVKIKFIRRFLICKYQSASGAS